DNVWLVHPRRSLLNNRLSVWRHGRLIQELTIPSVESVGTLIADKPGSVFIWSHGLSHLTTKQKDGTGGYQIAASYVVPASASEFVHSDLGYLVGSAFRDGEQQLYLVRLPRDEKE